MKRINEFGLNVGTADERMKLSDRHKAVWKMTVSGTRQDTHDLNVGSHSGTGSPERFLFPKIWLFSKYGCYLQPVCNHLASLFSSSGTCERISSMAWVPVFHALASIQLIYAHRKQMTARVFPARFSNSCKPNSSIEFFCPADFSIVRTNLFLHESVNPDCRTDAHFSENPLRCCYKSG